MELANSCDAIHCHCSITWPATCIHYAESWPQFDIQCYAVCLNSTYVGQPKVLWGLFVQLRIGPNPHSLTVLPVAHITSILSPQMWTVDWNFLVAADPLLYNPLFFDKFKYQLSISTTCLARVRKGAACCKRIQSLSDKSEEQRNHIEHINSTFTPGNDTNCKIAMAPEGVTVHCHNSRD